MNTLHKPRHADGRLMIDGEIRALDGDALTFCVAEMQGWKSIARRDAKAMPGSLNAGVLRGSLRAIPDYHADISAAFTVDRPDWSWNYFDFFDGQIWECCCELEKIGKDGMVEFSVRCHTKLNERPTPADHAKARCIAALLLAAKIGE